MLLKVSEKIEFGETIQLSFVCQCMGRDYRPELPATPQTRELANSGGVPRHAAASVDPFDSRRHVQLGKLV